MEQKTGFNVVEGLIGSFIFMDLVVSVLGPFGLFGPYGTWNTALIGSFMFALGIMFLSVSKPKNRQKAKTAAGVCFFFGIFFILYIAATNRVIERFGTRGSETLQMGQFIAEFGFFFFVLHDIFFRLYQESRITQLLEKIYRGFTGAAMVLVVGILLLSL
jgi:hypothetical protein